MKKAAHREGKLQLFLVDRPAVFKHNIGLFWTLLLNQSHIKVGKILRCSEISERKRENFYAKPKIQWSTDLVDTDLVETPI